MKMLMISYPKAEAIRDALTEASAGISTSRLEETCQDLAAFLTKAMDPSGTPVEIEIKDLPEDEHRG